MPTYIVIDKRTRASVGEVFEETPVEAQRLAKHNYPDLRVEIVLKSELERLVSKLTESVSNEKHEPGPWYLDGPGIMRALMLWASADGTRYLPDDCIVQLMVRGSGIYAVFGKPRVYGPIYLNQPPEEVHMPLDSNVED